MSRDGNNPATPSASVDPESLPRLIRQRGPAPVHLWNPPYCGEMDMRIASDGTWYHEGRPIRRARLVRLFSSILKREEGRHFLVTPAEKVGITVDDCPFLAQLADVQGEGSERIITLTLNTGETVDVDAQHPISVADAGPDEEPHPVVHVRSGLMALLARPVFYQLVALAEEDPRGDSGVLGVWSRGCFFPLGDSED